MSKLGLIQALRTWADNALFHGQSVHPVVDPQLRGILKEAADSLQEAHDAQASEQSPSPALTQKAAAGKKPPTESSPPNPSGEAP